MLPLTKIATGFLLVMLDFRIDGLDVLADPIGWFLVAGGVSALGLSNARTAAWALAAFSLIDLALPTQLVRTDPQSSTDGAGNSSQTYTETREVVVGDARAAVIFAYGLAMTAALWLILTGLERRARTAGDPWSADRLRTLRWIDVATTAGVASLVLLDRFDGVTSDTNPPLPSLVLVLSVIAITGALWLVGALYRRARHDWAQ